MKGGPTHPKVRAATGGASVAGAAVTLINVILYHATGYNPSPAEVGAEVTVATALGAFIAGRRQPSY